VTLLPLHRPTPLQRRSRTLRALVVSVVLGATCVAPATAFADGDAVISDCAQDSQLSKNYTQAEYKDALANIPTDVDEYTDCRDVIRRAQLKAAGAGGSGTGDGGGSSAGGVGGTGGTGTGGGGTGATGDAGGGNGLNDVDTAIAAASPQERDALTKAIGGSTPVTVGGRELSPSALTRGDLSSSTSIPGPLLAVLILLALGTVAALTPTLRTVVRSRRHGPLA
jgi:hypothetical protein